MNLKLLTPLLLSLFAASAFAHKDHDDDEPQVPLKQEAKKEAKPAATKPGHSHDALAKKDKVPVETPADPAPAEPKKTP